MPSRRANTHAAAPARKACWSASRRAPPGRDRTEAAELPAGSRVLGFNYDTGERYLSVEGFLPA